MKIREWWSKPWVKNTTFFGILAILFLTDVGKWIQVEVTRWRLDAPEYITASAQTNSIYRYDVQLIDADGERVSLSSFNGKPVFLNLWASWCVPCLAEFEGLEELRSAMPEFTFVTMNIEAQPAFERYLEKTSVDLPFYRAATPLPGELTPDAIPASYVLDEEGNVIYSFTGAADWSNPKVVEQLRKLLQP